MLRIKHRLSVRPGLVRMVAPKAGRAPGAGAAVRATGPGGGKSLGTSRRGQLGRYQRDLQLCDELPRVFSEGSRVHYTIGLDKDAIMAV